MLRSLDEYNNLNFQFLFQRTIQNTKTMNTQTYFYKNLPSSKKDKLIQSNDTDFSKKLHNKNQFLAQKNKLESDDSQGSDISYQSSIESEQDINIGRIQYFKEEMGRFFINYPQLINNDIIQKDSDIQYSQNLFSASYSKNWSILSKQILAQSKESSTFLQSLAKRIAVYRSKIQQQDIIDVLLKQQKSIMKQIDSQINAKKKQANKGTKNIQSMQGSDNMFFSWRKKRQNQFISNIVPKSPKLNLSKQKRQESNNKQRSRTQDRIKPQKSKLVLTTRDQNLSVSKSKTFYKDNSQNNFFLTSTNHQNQPKNSQTTIRKPTWLSIVKPQKTNQNKSLVKARSIFSMEKQQGGKLKQHLDNQTFNQQEKGSSNRSQNFWKHLVNFEPKTEAGRQLCDMIKKTCNPSDELGIKKTIMNYLIRSKDMIKNQIIHKSTISQKIQKLYNDDSKELLMFYPTKLNMLNQLNDREEQSEKKIKTNLSINGGGVAKQSEKFMKILQQISQGPLMKYWIQLQQNKL